MPNIFRKNISPHCSYCANSAPMDDTYVVCSKKGIVSMDSACRKFCYDPLRRTPPKPAVLRGQFTAADFALCEEESPCD